MISSPARHATGAHFVVKGVAAHALHRLEGAVDYGLPSFRASGLTEREDTNVARGVLQIERVVGIPSLGHPLVQVRNRACKADRLSIVLLRCLQDCARRSRVGLGRVGNYADETDGET